MSNEVALSDPEASIELLHRQLMEFEVLQAMYPDDDEASNQRCEMVSDASAVRALVEDWESSGEAPSVDALAALPPLKMALTVDVPQQSGADDGGDATASSASASSITLWATLPPTYPTAAPSLELSATHLPRDATREVLRRLEELAAERTAALAYWHGEYVAIDRDEDAARLAEVSLPSRHVHARGVR